MPHSVLVEVFFALLKLTRMSCGRSSIQVESAGDMASTGLRRNKWVGYSTGDQAKRPVFMFCADSCLWMGCDVGVQRHLAICS